MPGIRQLFVALSGGTAAGVLFSMVYLPLGAHIQIVMVLLVALIPLATRLPVVLMGAAAFLLTCWVAMHLPTHPMDQRVVFASDRFPVSQLPELLQAQGWQVLMWEPTPERELQLRTRNPTLHELAAALREQRIAILHPPLYCGTGRQVSLLWGVEIVEQRLVLRRWYARQKTDLR
jgi:hypothetical protein